jgi:hypothetical protein
MTAATAWAGRKLLGPLFDEMAEDLRQRYADRRARNVLRIISSAAAKSGRALDDPGTVPPRLLGLLLDEGSWCEDEVMAEYWAGILAAARTRDGRDDRGATWAKLVSRLSSFQVRTHYLLYCEMRRAVLEAPPFDIGSSTLCDEFTAIYVPTSAFIKALDPGEGVEAVLSHTVLGLQREGLISDRILAYGPKSDIEGLALITVPEGGLVAAASWAGIELFFWAHARSNLVERDFGRPDLPLDGAIIDRFEDAVPVYRLRSASPQ